MRSVVVLLAAVGLGACAQDPVAQQATVDTRYDPVRADTMLAVNFAPSSGGPDGAQVSGLRGERVGQVLANAGARWVSTSVEPAMAMGPNTVVVVRSEYLLGFNNCPNYSPATTANPNEAAMPGFGCSDSYNMGQMLARPRDAAVGRPAGPADATINALAIARYREGKVAALNTSGMIGGAAAGAGGGGGGGGASSPPSN